MSTMFYNVGQDSIVSIATHYRLDSPGMDSQLGVRFSTPLWTGPEFHQPSVQWYWLIPGRKAAGAWC